MAPAQLKHPPCRMLLLSAFKGGVSALLMKAIAKRPSGVTTNGIHCPKKLKVTDRGVSEQKKLKRSKPTSTNGKRSNMGQQSRQYRSAKGFSA